MVENVFSKVVISKTYSEAMEIAKNCNLTCITSDFQVVHAGAFLTRVGHYNRSLSDRFTLYQEILSIKEEIYLKSIEIQELEQLKDKFKN